MTIHIEALTIQAIIGILNFERTSPQKIVIEVKIDYFYQKEAFINYAEVITLIETLIFEKKYKLLEEALEDIKSKILHNYSTIKHLYIKISKPNIIKNANVALSLKWFSKI